MLVYRCVCFSSCSAAIEAIQTQSVCSQDTNDDDILPSALCALSETVSHLSQNTPTADDDSRNSTVNAQNSPTADDDSRNSTVNAQNSPTADDESTVNLQNSPTADDDSRNCTVNPQNSPTVDDDSRKSTVNAQNSPTVDDESLSLIHISEPTRPY